MIKKFNEFLMESWNKDEKRQAEQDTMEYDASLDSAPNEFPNVEDDWVDPETAEEDDEEEENAEDCAEEE